jgi:UTP--glucose-1-phosphate uridylyltransferase
MLQDPRVDWAFLERYRFDRRRFEDEARRIARGALSSNSAIIRGRIEPVTGVVTVDFERDGSARDAGEAALAAGKAAVVVLNGGMATRYGGVVKGVVEVFDGKSFIALKAEDARRASERFGRTVPFVLMNSFATETATAEHLESRGLAGADVLSFTQSISIRLNPDGSLFIGDDEKPSYHAPGHGDFFSSIRSSGVLRELMSRGVEYLLFSNVDNLGATVDATILGHHILSKKAMTVEVTEKRRTASGAWDKGGAPATVDGVPQLVEGFRFPPDFAQETLPDFSTNNMVFTAGAIDRDIPLERHVVKKEVDGRAAIQLESIACEASTILPLLVLRVPREGPRGRFFPVKEPIDLEESRAKLKERLEAGWRAT